MDITTLFGKLEEHDQELICLEKREKNIKKSNNKDKEVEKNSIALVASSSKYSTKKHDESGYSDKEKFDGEEMGLFVKWNHKYIKRNEVKHSDNNLINFRRQVNSSKQDKNKKGKSKSSCFNYGKVGHYKPDCP